MSGRPRRPLLYLVGAAGFPNYGDEMIAAGWLEYLARVAPDADVWLDCPHPGTAAVLLDGLHPRARFVDTFWRLAWLAPVEGVADVAAFTQEAVHHPGLGARWVDGIELAARADIVHVIGGGFVNDQWPRQIGVLSAAVAAAGRSGGRAALTGAGLSPAATATARVLAALAERLDVVDTRDEVSAHLLERDGATTCDDLFLHEDLGAPDPARADARGHVLCLQSDVLDEHQVRELAGLTLATLREWHVDPGDLAVVEGIPGYDRVVWALIEHELSGARFYPFTEVWSGGLPVAPHQTWLSTRFHLHLHAAAAGASGLALTTDADYYQTKHASLTAQGSGWSVVSDWTAVPDRPKGTFDPATVCRLHRAKQSVAAAVYDGVAAGSPAPTDGAALGARGRAWRPLFTRSGRPEARRPPD